MKSIPKNAKGVSLSQVKQIWSAFNDAIFEGKLAEPIFRITRDRRNFGKFVWRPSDSRGRCAIYISGVLHSDRKFDLGDTIAHEMVHQWQHQQGLKYNEHDETFTKWIPIIKEKVGITLQESWNECIE